jgi:hypothetical protein
MGLLESISAIAPAIGLTLGGALVALASPRFAFTVVGAGATLTAIAFARIHIDTSETPLARPDLELQES